MYKNYKDIIVEVTVPLMNSEAILNAISAYAMSAKIEVDRIKLKSQYRLVRYTFRNQTEADRFKIELGNVFNPNFLRISQKEKLRYKDDWELLEALLKSHDWYFQMSDDHRYWQSGQIAWDRIKELMRMLLKLDRTRVQSLYVKYNPDHEEFSF